MDNDADVVDTRPRERALSFLGKQSGYVGKIVLIFVTDTLAEIASRSSPITASAEEPNAFGSSEKIGRVNSSLQSTLHYILLAPTSLLRALDKKRIFSFTI